MKRVRWPVGTLRLQPKGVVGFSEVKVDQNIDDIRSTALSPAFTVRRGNWSVDVPPDFDPVRLKVLLDVLVAC